VDERLSQISTAWTLLRQVHEGPADDAREALELLLRRYRGAVVRYLERAVGNDAEDLAQEFSVALLRGQFRHADPEKGRFRDYVRASLCHLADRHRQGLRKLPIPTPEAGVQDADGRASPAEEDERLFNAAWREELLRRAWEALREVRAEWYEVLHFSALNRDLRSPELARLLGERLGRELSADGVRQIRHRAGEKFADLLLAEVAHSLEDPTADALAEELGELGLLECCRSALTRRGA
jgi:RNA polymerase sigma-70 factor (ECF subfamily)